MRIAATLLFVLITLAATIIITPPSAIGAGALENSWVTKAPMHQARSGLGVAAARGRIYAIGGSTASGWAPSIPPSTAYNEVSIRGFVGTNEEYDPAADEWTDKAPMPTPRMFFAIAAVQNRIYCIGGRTTAAGSIDGYTAANEVYDPATDTWEKKAPLPTAAAWLVASVVENRIHLIANSQTHYVYDVANDSWTTKAPAPQALFFYASAVLDEQIFIVNYSPLLISYNSETDKWALRQSPPSSLAGGAGGATTGVMSIKRVYFFGEKANLEQGENPGFVRVYNPVNDDWTYGADSPTDHYCFGVAALNDTFYVIGGHTYTFPGNFTPTAVNEQYTPFGYGTPDPSPVIVPDRTAPKIAVASPENISYPSGNVSLTFSVNEPATEIAYSLDGAANVTIAGNTTLTGLANGNHSVTVYATDEAGNTGASETLSFNVNVLEPEPETEPFPSVPVVVAVSAVAVAAAAGLLIYFKKHKREVKS